MITRGGGGVPALPILVFLSIYAYTLYYCRTTKLDVVTRGGGAYILGSATPPIPEQSFMSPQFFGFFCLHPLTQYDQIQHGNTYGEGHVQGRSDGGTSVYIPQNQSTFKIIYVVVLL